MICCLGPRVTIWTKCKKPQCLAQMTFCCRRYNKAKAIRIRRVWAGRNSGNWQPLQTARCMQWADCKKQIWTQPGPAVREAVQASVCVAAISCGRTLYYARMLQTGLKSRPVRGNHHDPD